MGVVEIGSHQARRLGVRAHRPWSPVIEKCSLRTCAQLSYGEAEAQIRMLMGVSIGHSSLHRLVNQTPLPASEGDTVSNQVSIDGGKIRLRHESGGVWQDYKAVSLSDGRCDAFFQDNDQLQTWSTQQPLSPTLVLLGDGHDGIWNIARTFGGDPVHHRCEILDWFHLMENLAKVPMSASLSGLTHRCFIIKG